MKLNSDYLYTELADDSVLVPTGDAAKSFHGIIRLNETGKFIYRCISENLTKTQIAARLTQEYDVSEDAAEKAAGDFIAELLDAGVVEED
ncbi:MAG: PqqD family protein [Clostridiales bacterium]|nr:PqqD family protein [Clostridiales bacterium]